MPTANTQPWLPTRTERMAWALTHATDAILDLTRFVPHRFPHPDSVVAPQYWFVTEHDVPSVWPVDEPYRFVCPRLLTVQFAAPARPASDVYVYSVEATPTHWEADWIAVENQQVIPWWSLRLLFSMVSSSPASP
jgi:hypothetical protein